MEFAITASPHELPLSCSHTHSAPHASFPSQSYTVLCSLTQLPNNNIPRWPPPIQISCVQHLSSQLLHSGQPQTTVARQWLAAALPSSTVAAPWPTCGSTLKVEHVSNAGSSTPGAYSSARSLGELDVQFPEIRLCQAPRV